MIETVNNTDMTIVRDVRERHDETVVADTCLSASARHAAMRGHTFAERALKTNFSMALANPSSSFEEVT